MAYSAKLQIELPSGIEEKRLLKIADYLRLKPATTAELANHLKVSVDVVEDYINFLKDGQVIERVRASYYYQYVNWNYRLDAIKDVREMPEPMFRQLPLIKEWAAMAGSNGYRNQLIKDFYRVCSGQVLSGFSRFPSQWRFPDTPMEFLTKYRDKLDTQPPRNIGKAINAFLSICLRVPQSYLKTMDLHWGDDENGEWRYIKLTAEELQKAKEWLKIQGKNQLKEGLQYDELLCHFAFQLETFGRPSRILTIEVDKISKVTNDLKDYSKGRHLEVTMLETKQNAYWPKYVMDPELVEWAIPWIEKRRELGYKYLLYDENYYVPKHYDSWRLKDRRCRYARVYKEMFKALGKKEAYFYNDTLYSLRHCGVQLWYERLGPEKLHELQSMGWDDMRTLTKYYAGLDRQAITLQVLSTAKT